MPALGQALAFAAEAGADPAKIREVVLTPTGGNYLPEKWLPQNVMRDTYEPGFALKLMHEDPGAAALRRPRPRRADGRDGLDHRLFAQAKGVGYGREGCSAATELSQAGRRRRDHRHRTTPRPQEGAAANAYDDERSKACRWFASNC